MIGVELLHYRITRALGSGGMGEVYLAEDLRLKRQVAIKILPPAVAASADSRERFAREARAVASLNHPNIVTIHSVESVPATDASQKEIHFLTMEYVEGRTLAELLTPDGLPLRQLLTIATQIADAMAGAHHHGIVHRDLKPANVMVTGQGRVKVLDFGVAKLREASAEPAGSLPTRELTGEGYIVGTVAYMSPEQAEGKHVDERSDIFSLGVILYEMATGERPFKGDTDLSVLSSVLRDTPRTVTDLNPRLSPEFARIVRRCLVKDPEHRVQSAKDLRNELEELQAALPSDERTVLQRERRSGRLTAIAAGVCGVVLIAVLAGLWFKSPPKPTAPPVASHTRLTQMTGLERFPSPSPDGRWVVYSADGDIYLQSVTGQTPINLTKDTPSAETMPAFSPDGESIAFRSDRDGGGIFVMGRTGEAVRRVTTQGFAPAWLPDGRQLVFSTRGLTYPVNRDSFSELWVADTEGGQPRQLFGGDAVQPRVSPHGKRIAFCAVPVDGLTKRFVPSRSGFGHDVWTIDLDGKYPVRVTTHDGTDWNPAWSPDGRWLYFLSDRSGSMNLWRVAIDESSGAITGDPQPLTAPTPYMADFGLSADGALATYSSILINLNVGRVDFDAQTASVKGPVSSVTSGTNEIINIDAIGDGTSIVASTVLSQPDLLIVSPEGTIRRLTNDKWTDRAPRWIPGSGQIVFNSDRSGILDIWRIGADGGGLKQLTSGGLFYPVPSRDGKRVAAADRAARQIVIFDSRDFSKPLEILPAFGDPTVEPVPSDWSPDDRHLAIDSLAGMGVWVYSFDSRTYRRLGDGTDSSWLSDGRRLLSANRGGIWVIDTISGNMKEVITIPGETLGYPLALAGDSQLLFRRGSFLGDIWIARFSEK